MKSIRVIQSSVVIGSLMAAAAFAACQGTVGGLSPGGPTGSTTGGTTGSTTVGSTGATSGSTGSTAGTTTTTPGQVILSDGAVAQPDQVLPGALPPAPGSALVPESSGQLLMRRLTNTEYDNIVAHLVGDTTQPGTAFSTDPIGVNGYVGPTSVAQQNVLTYYQTAQALVATALATPTATGNQLAVPTTTGTAGATTFINSFGLLAYRRPVAAAELSDLLTIVFSPAIAGGATFKEAIGYVAQAMLNSPNFLYHWEIGPTEPTLDTATGLVPLTPWQVASRLSMTLWNDMPDSTLLTAAQNNELGTAAQVQAQATRMYADPRAAQALFDMNLQWLLQVAGNTTDLSAIVHSSTQWSTGVATSLQGEFTNFLSSVYGPTGTGTFQTLMTAPYAYVNSSTASIYGVTAPAGTGFSQVQLNATQRAGVFTQLAFLASQADTNEDNPVRRGLAIYENLLCGGVNPPPNFVPAVGSADAGETTRDLFAAHAQPGSSCAACHQFFDPPGFAFENYDQVGAYRTLDNGGAVDPTGSFVTPGGCIPGHPCGTTITFTNAVNLVTQLAALPEAQWCAERQWYRYAAARVESSAELGSLQLAFQKGSATAGFSLRDSLTSLVGSVAFLNRTPSPGETL